MLARCLSPLILFAYMGNAEIQCKVFCFQLVSLMCLKFDGLCCWFNVDRISFSTLYSHNLVP